MITYRKIEIEVEYPKLCSWWKDHGALAVPQEILPPDAWIAESGGVEIAASFLYVAKGNIAVIEWTTTNPRCAYSRDLVEAVKGLYAKLEEEAKAEGCAMVLSFVKPNGSEQRIMAKAGYVTSTDDVGHRLYAKPLRNAEAFNPPADGVLKCP